MNQYQQMSGPPPVIFEYNPELISARPFSEINGKGFVFVKAAQNRYMRFLPYVALAFPETAEKKGVIESPLEELSCRSGAGERIFLKDDSRLPIAGSAAGRGCFHELMVLAEKHLQENRMLLPNENYAKIGSDTFRSFFGQYSISITGDHETLYASEIFARRLGYRIAEHGDPNSHLIGSPESEALFWGYATAAVRLAVQLSKAGVETDEKHPLRVFLPLTDEAAAGGIIYGLRQKYGDAVHCLLCAAPEWSVRSVLIRKMSWNLVSGVYVFPKLRDSVPSAEDILSFVQNKTAVPCPDAAVNIIWKMRS